MIERYLTDANTSGPIVGEREFPRSSRLSSVRVRQVVISARADEPLPRPLPRPRAGEGHPRSSRRDAGRRERALGAAITERGAVQRRAPLGGDGRVTALARGVVGGRRAHLSAACGIAGAVPSATARSASRKQMMRRTRCSSAISAPSQPIVARSSRSRSPDAAIAVLVPRVMARKVKVASRAPAGPGPTPRSRSRRRWRQRARHEQT